MSGLVPLVGVSQLHGFDRVRTDEPRPACSARRYYLAERIFCVRLEELVCALVRDTQDGADVSNAEACGAKLPCGGAPVL